MTAKLTFRSVQTPYGVQHTMRVTDGNAKLTGLAGPVDYALYSVRPVADYLGWVGPAYMAANGTAWRIGRSVTDGLVAWKSTKFSQRFGRESYRMRSVPGGYKGDFVTLWSRAVNGKSYSFSRVFWNAGKDGATLRIYRGQTTEVLHEWYVPGPVQLKTKRP